MTSFSEELFKKIIESQYTRVGKKYINSNTKGIDKNIIDLGVGSGLCEMAYLKLKVNNIKLEKPILGLYYDDDIKDEYNWFNYEITKETKNFWESYIDFHKQNITEYDPEDLFDIVVISQILHLIQEDKLKHINIIRGWFSKLKPKGSLFLKHNMRIKGVYDSSIEDLKKDLIDISPDCKISVEYVSDNSRSIASVCAILNK